MLREELAETNHGLVALNIELGGSSRRAHRRARGREHTLTAEIVERRRVERERVRLLAAEQEARPQAEEAVQVRDEFICRSPPTS